MGILTNNNTRIELPGASEIFTIHYWTDPSTEGCARSMLEWLDKRTEVKEYIVKLFTNHESLNSDIIELSQRLSGLDKMIMYGLNNGELHSYIPDLTYHGAPADIQYVDVRCSFDYTQYISGSLIITYLPFGSIEEKHVVGGEIQTDSLNAFVYRDELQDNNFIRIHNNTSMVSPIYATYHNTYALQPLRFSLLWDQNLCTL